MRPFETERSERPRFALSAAPPLPIESKEAPPNEDSYILDAIDLVDSDNEHEASSGGPVRPALPADDLAREHQ